jgi:uncharacterized protein DUF3618
MGERAQLNPHSGESVGQLRSQIAETRGHLSETMEEIQARLAPRAVVARATSVARGAAERTAHTFATRAEQAVCQAAGFAGSIKRKLNGNSMPAMLVGLGIGGYLVTRLGRSTFRRRLGGGSSVGTDARNIWPAFHRPTIAKGMNPVANITEEVWFCGN